MLLLFNKQNAMGKGRHFLNAAPFGLVARKSAIALAESYQSFFQTTKSCADSRLEINRND